MADLIDRNKALAETWKEPRYTDPLNVLTEIRERIRNLPSAQPNTCDGCKWDGAIGYGECHHCKRAFSDMYEEGGQDEH